MKITFKNFDELKSKTSVLFRELDNYAAELKRLYNSNGLRFRDLGEYKILPDDEKKFELLKKDKDFVAALETIESRLDNIKRSCGLDNANSNSKVA
jgi:hypothetical protein